MGFKQKFFFLKWLNKLVARDGSSFELFLKMRVDANDAVGEFLADRG